MGVNRISTEADYALERAARAGFARTQDGRWFGPAVHSTGHARKKSGTQDIQLKDRYSGNPIWLTLRDGRVVGEMGTEPARYMGKTIAEAQHMARYGGGRSSGSTSHARRKGRSPRLTPYQLTLTPEEQRVLTFASGRYARSDMLANHLDEHGTVALTEGELWRWIEDVDSDMEGGHSAFPLSSPSLANKLHHFYNSRV